MELFFKQKACTSNIVTCCSANTVGYFINKFLGFNCMGTLRFHIISILKLNFKFMKKDVDLHTLMRIFRAIK